MPSGLPAGQPLSLSVRTGRHFECMGRLTAIRYRRPEKPSTHSVVPRCENRLVSVRKLCLLFPLTGVGPFSLFSQLSSTANLPSESVRIDSPPCHRTLRTPCERPNEPNRIRTLFGVRAESDFAEIFLLFSS